MNRLRALVSASLLVLALVPPRADALQASPAPAACTTPDVPASTLEVGKPTTPVVAQHYGVGGVVTIAVTLDANDAIAKAVVYKSTDHEFDATALAAAQRSRFRGAVVHCVHQPGPYSFVVRFDPQYVPIKVDPFAYFPGHWQCTAPDGTVSEEVYTIRGEGADRTLRHTVASGDFEDLVLDEFSLWHAKGFAPTAGTAYPWVDAKWQFVNGPTEADYERVDARTFVRTTLVLSADGPRDALATRCSRLKP